MDKISLCPVDGEEAVGFFVLEETRIGGVSYLLVTESEEGDSEAYILKDLSEDGDPEAKYVFVEDDRELEAVSKVFEELLEDVDLEL
ncbi:MAG: DUF1292 domain-containing protein [Lachnospiraceae bacterium]|nr:DUF1292 domain-containing protein [Lachnospiraceae bacterium]